MAIGYTPLMEKIMEKLIAPSRVFEILREAFKPYECQAELEDNHTTIHVKVVGPGHSTLEQRGLRLDLLQNRNVLIGYIERWRKELEHTGAVFEPWEMPEN